MPAKPIQPIPVRVPRPVLSDTGMLSGLASCAAIRSDILAKHGESSLGSTPSHPLPWPYGGFRVTAEALHQAAGISLDIFPDLCSEAQTHPILREDTEVVPADLQ